MKHKILSVFEVVAQLKQMQTMHRVITSMGKKLVQISKDFNAAEPEFQDEDVLRDAPDLDFVRFLVQRHAIHAVVSMHANSIQHYIKTFYLRWKINDTDL